jgi:5'-phosphate synthase pdxT subunit
MVDSPATPGKIAVLALQGDFEKHVERLRGLGADAYPARLPSDIDEADGIILPGGESTTIGKLLSRYGVDIALRRAHEAGKPIYGTCAGMILLAREIDAGTAERGGQPVLGLMDIKVARNAYGRQIDSFETVLESAHLPGMDGENLEAVFIRAPSILSTGPEVETLATYDGQSVLVQQNNLLASSFHPELTADTRIHEYFLSLVERHATKH